MKETTIGGRPTPLLRWGALVAGAAVLFFPVCSARSDSRTSLAPDAVAGEVAHERKMRLLFPDQADDAQLRPGSSRSWG